MTLHHLNDKEKKMFDSIPDKFDAIGDGFSLAQYEDYSGIQIDCEGILPGAVNELKIKGQTFHNLLDLKKFKSETDEIVIDLDTNSLTLTKKRNEISYIKANVALKPNTMYTLMFEVVSNSISKTDSANYSFYPDGGYGDIESVNDTIQPFNATGVMCRTVHTKAKQADICGIASFGFHQVNVGAQLIIKNLMLIEGENLSYLPSYIDGIKSVGDNNNKSILDSNALTFPIHLTANNSSQKIAYSVPKAKPNTEYYLIANVSKNTINNNLSLASWDIIAEKQATNQIITREDGTGRIVKKLTTKSSIKDKNWIIELWKENSSGEIILDDLQIVEATNGFNDNLDKEIVIKTHNDNLFDTQAFIDFYELETEGSKIVINKSDAREFHVNTGKQNVYFSYENLSKEIVNKGVGLFRLQDYENKIFYIATGGTESDGRINAPKIKMVNGIKSIAIVNWATKKSLLNNIQVLRDDVIEYVSPKSTSSYINLSEPLRGFGDNIYDELNGSTITRKIGHAFISNIDDVEVKNGTDQNSSYTKTNQFIITNVLPYNAVQTQFCNKKFGVSSNFPYNFENADYQHFYCTHKNIVLFIDKKVAPNATALKKWIKENPLEVLYTMEASIIETISSDVSIVIPTDATSINSLCLIEPELSIICPSNQAAINKELSLSIEDARVNADIKLKKLTKKCNDLQLTDSTTKTSLETLKAEVTNTTKDLNEKIASTYKFVKFLESENLDNVTQPGFYIQQQDKNTSTERHYPELHAGLLEVFNYGGAGHRFQRYTSYGNFRTIYIRAWYSGTNTWSNWANQDNATTLSGVKLISSTNRYGRIPLIGDDGGLEIGKYIDFHQNDGNENDNDGRIHAQSNGFHFNMQIHTSEITGTYLHLKTYPNYGADATADIWLDNRQNTKKLVMDSVGELIVPNGKVTATSWGTSSDRRCKRVLGRNVDSDLDKILKVEPQYFEYLHERTPDKHYGFIAQDLEKVIPTSISTNIYEKNDTHAPKDKDGNVIQDHKTINPMDLIATLWGACKELNKKVESLQEQLSKS